MADLDLIPYNLYASKIGIGTTMPGFELDVVGNGHFSGNLTLDGTLTVAIGAGSANNFVISNGGLLEYRTAAQVLSDIGAAPGTGSSSYIQNQNTIKQSGLGFNILSTDSYIYNTNDNSTGTGKVIVFHAGYDSGDPPYIEIADDGTISTLGANNLSIPAATGNGKVNYGQSLNSFYIISASNYTSLNLEFPVALGDANLFTTTGGNPVQFEMDLFVIGNAGIGTTVPTTKLTVFGTDAAPANSGTTATAISRITAASGVSLDMGINGAASPVYSWLQCDDRTDQSLHYNFVINPNGGNVGIGTTTPTASFHIKAGTATAGTAPMKLTAGTNLTTPEAGAIEFDGTNLYYTTTTPTRRTIATNPMTTLGDMIYGGSSGTPTRLGIGSSGELLTISSGIPSWSTALPNGTTATTQSPGDNSTKVATTAYVNGSYLPLAGGVLTAAAPINYTAGSYIDIGNPSETHGQSIRLSSNTRAGNPYVMQFYSDWGYSFLKNDATALVTFDNVGGAVFTEGIIVGAAANLKNYTVSTLPFGTRGDIAYVTDATSPVPLATVVGGGSSVVPVFYNGTNWIVL